MARTYKRDSRGRFAGGGGSSSGGKRSGSSKASSGGGRKRNKSFVTTTGSFLTRGRAKVAQAKRTKAFSSKATVGRSAKEAYKAASGAKRKGAKASAAESTRATYRTRQQATRAQRERSRRTVEFGRSAPGAGFIPGITAGASDRRGGTSMRRVSVKVPQGNLFTGRFDMHVVRTRTTFGGSKIGPSVAARKTAKRRARAEARYETLLQERKAITSKGRVRSGELARNSQRMAAVSRAFPVYDMGPGSRPPRKRTGSRVRNSGDRN